jgi:hypothetical protein
MNFKNWKLFNFYRIFDNAQTALAYLGIIDLKVEAVI